MDSKLQRRVTIGQIPEGDLKSQTASSEISEWRGRERFLILTREAGVMAENLRSVLEALGQVEVIVDRPVDDSLEVKGCYIHLTDKEAAGYAGLMSKSFPGITAWSRAFAHLEQTLGDNEAVWFVEDDVAGDPASFAELVRATAAKAADLSALAVRTRHEDPQWPWWSYADGLFTTPCRAFQPLCRLSGRLVRAVLDFQNRHQRLTFHEVLFASLVHEHGMTWLGWRRDEATRNLLANFRYRPEVEQIDRGILHPVKDPGLHEAICRLPPVADGRRSQAACEGWSIFPDDYDFLVSWCRKQGFKTVVEFGPGDSTLALLDAGCRVVSYEHDLVWLQKTIEKFEGEDDVEIFHCPEGCVPDPPEVRPDLVLVDGPPFREGQRMSRLAPCEWALEVCGCFLLHDSKRGGERATLAEMKRRGMHVTQIDTKKGLALVVDPLRRPELILPMPKEKVKDGSRKGAAEKSGALSSFSLIHLPEAGLSIFTIPKNGGTTLWAWVYFLRTKGKHLPGNVYSETWLREGPLQKQKMIVRRDPVERFISAYRNFRDKRGLALGFDDFFEQFPHLYQTNGEIHRHFMPQSSYYPKVPLESFDHIVDFEHFHEAKRLIEELSGEQVPDIHHQRAEFCDFEVHEWQAETIARFYQCDYDLGFGIPDVWRRGLT